LRLSGSNQLVQAGVPVDVNNQLLSLQSRMANAESLAGGTSLANTVNTLVTTVGSNSASGSAMARIYNMENLVTSSSTLVSTLAASIAPLVYTDVPAGNFYGAWTTWGGQCSMQTQWH
jgi:hypothetical protein